MLNVKHHFLRVINRMLFTYYIVCSRYSKRKGTILMFHHVSDKLSSPYCVSPYNFELLLKKLSKMHVVKLEDFKQAENFFSLSFDDVPDDFYFNAYPLLKRYNIPFTLFISTSLLDTDGYLSRYQLKEIALNELATIGSHGVTHDYFVKFSREKFLEELKKSKEFIEELIGKPVQLFAFPYGSYTTSGLCYKHFVQEFYKYGFSTIPTDVTKRHNAPDYFVPRLNCNENIIFKIVNL